LRFRFLLEGVSSNYFWRAMFMMGIPSFLDSTSLWPVICVGVPLTDWTKDDSVVAHLKDLVPI